MGVLDGHLTIQPSEKLGGPEAGSGFAQPHSWSRWSVATFSVVRRQHGGQQSWSSRKTTRQNRKPGRREPSLPAGVYTALLSHAAAVAVPDSGRCKWGRRRRKGSSRCVAPQPPGSRRDVVARAVMSPRTRPPPLPYLFTLRSPIFPRILEPTTATTTRASFPLRPCLFKSGASPFPNSPFKLSSKSLPRPTLASITSQLAQAEETSTCVAARSSPS